MIMMPFLVTSNLAAILLLIVLIASGSLTGFRWVSGSRRRRKNFVIFEVSHSKVQDLAKILKTIAPPFTLEVAVSQLGKEKSFYIALPAGRAKTLENVLGAKRVEDYDLYYPGGAVSGGYASGEESIKSINLDSVDFGEVNEIGEGAVVQLVFNKKSREGVSANVRVLASAPSSYQAKEIILRIKSSLAHMKLKFTEVKSSEFVESVNARSFSENELARFSL